MLIRKEAKQAPGFQDRAAHAFALYHFNPYLIGHKFLICKDHKPNLSIVKSKTKVYDTLRDEILSYLPFHMEYLNGTKTFADVLLRPLGCSDINAVLTNKTCPEKSEIQLTLLHQTHDHAGHLPVLEL